MATVLGDRHPGEEATLNLPQPGNVRIPNLHRYNLCAAVASAPMEVRSHAVRLCYSDCKLATACYLSTFYMEFRAMATRKNEGFRVYRLPEAVRRSLKATRVRTMSRIRPCWSAVTKELPKIVATLKKLGIRPLQKTRPARLQVDADLLAVLRQGCQPAFQINLLVCSLGRFCHSETKGRK